MTKTKDPTATADHAAEAATTEGTTGAGAEGAAADGAAATSESAGRSVIGSLSAHGLQIAGIAIFSAASLGAAVFLGGTITLDEPTAEERDQGAREQGAQERPPDERIDPSLTGNELVRMGEAALDEGRIEAARRLLEAARMRVGPDEINLRIDLFSILARAEEVTGNDDVARLHRDYLTRLRESMGGSIKLFNAAERHFREGRLRQARVLYSRFLLRPGDLQDASERYLADARERLARIMERELAAASPGAMRMPLEPESYFDD